MNKIDIPKMLFRAVSITCAFGLIFSLGLYSGANRTAAYRFGTAIVDTVAASTGLVYEEASTLAKIRPAHYLQPARYAGDGVTLNKAGANGGDLVLLSGFFEDTNQLRLIRRDGTLVRRWPLHFSEIFPDTSHLSDPPKTDWNIDTDGALVLPDGSVVFNFTNGGLVKMDRCGEVVWTLARQTHHSLEIAEGGGFWVAGRREHLPGSVSPFPPFMTPFVEDTVLKVSDTGEVLEEISIPGLFYENGLETLLTATGHNFTVDMDWDLEIVHLNKVEELSSDIAADFPEFEAGDLAVSLRNYNLVMVLDPDTRKIKWWKIGPWRRQHDPEFKPGGTIVLFNNNSYRTAFGAGSDIFDPAIPRVSNIMEINPATGEHRVLYGGKPEQEMLSVIRGKVELTAGGGLLVTEYEAGRVFETDASGDIVWNYINRYDADEVAAITEARLYPVGYFNVADWSCAVARGQGLQPAALDRTGGS